MQFSSRLVYLPFRSKYPPQHSVLKNPQSVFLKVRDQVSHPYSTTEKLQFCILASFALLTTPNPLLENMLQTVDNFEISCLRAPFFMVRKAQKSHGARSGLYGGCSNGVLPVHFFKTEHRIQFRSRLMRFLGFSVMKRELRGEKFPCDQRSAARFREVGGAL
jgi:hypothetical protein